MVAAAAASNLAVRINEDIRRYAAHLIRPRQVAFTLKDNGVTCRMLFQKHAEMFPKSSLIGDPNNRQLPVPYLCCDFSSAGSDFAARGTPGCPGVEEPVTSKPCASRQRSGAHTSDYAKSPRVLLYCDSSVPDPFDSGCVPTWQLFNFRRVLVEPAKRKSCGNLIIKRIAALASLRSCSQQRAAPNGESQLWPADKYSSNRIGLTPRQQKPFSISSA